MVENYYGLFLKFTMLLVVNERAGMCVISKKTYYRSRLMYICHIMFDKCVYYNKCIYYAHILKKLIVLCYMYYNHHCFTSQR